MELHPPFIVFSVELTSRSAEENARCHDAAVARLAALDVQFISDVQGYYKGATERALLVWTPGKWGSETFCRVFKLAKDYDQESILYVDSAHAVYLSYVQVARTEYLGTWLSIDSSDPNNIQDMKAEFDSYSVIDGKYYVVD